MTRRGSRGQEARPLADRVDPAPMLDGPGGHWACKRSFPLLRSLDFWKP